MTVIFKKPVHITNCHISLYICSQFHQIYVKCFKYSQNWHKINVFFQISPETKTTPISDLSGATTHSAHRVRWSGQFAHSLHCSFARKCDTLTNNSAGVAYLGLHVERSQSWIPSLICSALYPPFYLASLNLNFLVTWKYIWFQVTVYEGDRYLKRILRQVALFVFAFMLKMRLEESFSIK